MFQMKCNVLSWNVRGLGSHNRKRLVWDLVSKTRMDIVILQETKLMSLDRDVICSLCHFASVGWISLPFVGEAKKILMFWDKDKIVCEESWVESFSVSMVATVRGDSQMDLVWGLWVFI